MKLEILGFSPTLGAIYRRNKKIFIVLALLIITMIAGELLVSGFLGANQVMQIIKLAAITGIFSLGQMIVISSGGGLDLSVGYIATVSAVVSARIVDGDNSKLVLGLLIGVGVGFAAGLLNGIGVAYFRVPALVMTMGMTSVLSGAINVYSSGLMISGGPAPAMQVIAARQSIGIFPNLLIVWILIITAATVILFRTKWGKTLFGVGANPVTAKLSGIDTKKVMLLAFLISGVIAGLCGQIVLGYMGQPMKDMASNYVMPSIAACVVGGVKTSGGHGNYIGVVLGAILLQTISSILIVMGTGDAGKFLGYGVMLLILLIVYAGNRRNR